MSHFAKVEMGIVTSVIVAEQEFINSGVVGDPSLWIQTSYNTRGGIHYQPNSNIPSEDQSKSLRKNYAGVGFQYDQQRDAFIPPKPVEYPSFILNEETCLWEAPIPYPNDGKLYNWNEQNQTWELSQNQ
jgi:hypothetical protein